MATGKERKQARADRYRERALQAKAGSTAAYRRSEELTKNIPSGQPILVGHHSEKRHRRALECSWNALGKSVELERKADYYAAKAEAAEHNRAIYAEDDDAVENLTERVAALESLQERMKAANRIIKNLKQTQEEKIEALCRLGFERRNAEELFVPNCFGQIGFADFTIRNNGANIRRLKKRLESVARLKKKHGAYFFIPKNIFFRTFPTGRSSNDGDRHAKTKRPHLWKTLPPTNSPTD